MEHINEIGEHDSSLPESVERINKRLSRSLSIEEAFNRSKKEFKSGISAECKVVTLPTLVDETLKEEDSVKEVKEMAQEKSFTEKKMERLGAHEAGIGHEVVVDRTLKAPPCVYVTQNSVNEDREVERSKLLVNRTSPVVNLKQDPFKAQFYRSFSKQVSMLEDQNGNKDGDSMYKQPHVAPKDNVETSVAIEIESCSKTLASKASSTQSVTGGHAELTWRRMLPFMIVSVLLSCVLIGIPLAVLEVHRILSSEPPVNDTKSEPDSQKHWHESYTDNAEHVRPIERFVLDQQFLKEEGKVRWKESEQTARSSVKPSQNESCVVVPEAGRYMVYSQITFAFDGLTDRSEVAHSVNVRSGTDVNMVQKKLIAVPYRDPKLPRRQQTMEPSNLITSAKVEAHDRICIEVSPANLVYVSQVDNALMVAKVE
ncbi:uncharacterized protein LOC128218973 [Mya arenaria]|nr:uncharacterized protein LOC128218973 [Mya arenaria]